MGESVARRLKGAPIKAGRIHEYDKNCEMEKKREPENRQMGLVFFCIVNLVGGGCKGLVVLHRKNMRNASYD